MDITQRDVMLLFTMGLAVVAMSFIFPSLGIGGDQVTENEIPELDVNASQFDFTGERPPPPGAPNTGDLEWRDDRDEQLNQVWLRGDTSGGVEMALLPPSGPNDSVQVTINEWSSGSVVYDERLNFSQSDVGNTSVYYNQSLGYRMTFEPLLIDRDAGDYTIRYEVLAQVTDAGWLSGVPVIGAAVEGAQATAATLGWFVELAVWALTYVFELLANAVVLASTVAVYFVSLITWLLTTYTSIVASAPGWVSVFVALPGILLGAVLGKIVIIAAGLLPTT
jgi:hypothetical protein